MIIKFQFWSIDLGKKYSFIDKYEFKIGFVNAYYSEIIVSFYIIVYVMLM